MLLQDGSGLDRTVSSELTNRLEFSGFTNDLNYSRQRSPIFLVLIIEATRGYRTGPGDTHLTSRSLVGIEPTLPNSNVGVLP